MSKFKKGDRVKNKKDMNYGFVIIPRGATGTIEQSESSCPFVRWDKYSQTARFETDLEPINENPIIVIYTKGNETIATLKQGKEVIKSAKAKCNPTDEFNFEFGAKLAFKRLMGEEEKEDIFDWDGFKKGKFAVHCDTEEKAKMFFKELKKQNIKRNSDAELEETRWRFYGKDTCYGYSNTNEMGICYGSFRNRKHIEYAPSTPRVKKVKRHANPNEYIQIVNEFDTDGKYKNGDILKVKYCHVETAVTVSEFEFPGIADTEYVVLENYNPIPKALSDYTNRELSEELLRRF